MPENPTERVVIEAAPELLEQMEGQWSPPVRVMTCRDTGSPTGWTIQVKLDYGDLDFERTDGATDGRT